MSNDILQNKTHKVCLTLVQMPCANSPKQVTHITCCNITACCCWRSAWSCCGDNTCCWRICCICWGVITWGVIMATDTGTCTRYHRQTHFSLPAPQLYIVFYFVAKMDHNFFLHNIYHCKVPASVRICYFKTTLLWHAISRGIRFHQTQAVCSTSLMYSCKKFKHWLVQMCI